MILDIIDVLLLERSLAATVPHPELILGHIVQGVIIVSHDDGSLFPYLVLLKHSQIHNREENALVCLWFTLVKILSCFMLCFSDAVFSLFFSFQLTSTGCSVASDSRSPRLGFGRIGKLSAEIPRSLFWTRINSHTRADTDEMPPMRLCMCMWVCFVCMCAWHSRHEIANFHLARFFLSLNKHWALRADCSH